MFFFRKKNEVSCCLDLLWNGSFHGNECGCMGWIIQQIFTRNVIKYGVWWPWKFQKSAPISGNLHYYNDIMQ